MWPFSRKPTKELLNDHKKVKICGMKFVIRKINPLIDFSADKMPQIFTSFISKRNIERLIDPKRINEDMMIIVESGVVEPELSPRGKPGITVEDLFRDQEIGSKLYEEILYHSMNHFRGIKKLFFWIKTKYSLYTYYQKLMEKRLLKSHSPKVGTL